MIFATSFLFLTEVRKHSAVAVAALKRFCSRRKWKNPQIILAILPNWPAMSGRTGFAVPSSHEPWNCWGKLLWSSVYKELFMWIISSLGWSSCTWLHSVVYWLMFQLSPKNYSFFFFSMTCMWTSLDFDLKILIRKGCSDCLGSLSFTFFCTVLVIDNVKASKLNEWV